jgi:hypothetical protein
MFFIRACILSPYQINWVSFVTSTTMTKRSGGM